MISHTLSETLISRRIWLVMVSGTRVLTLPRMLELQSSFPKNEMRHLKRGGILMPNSVHSFLEWADLTVLWGMHLDDCE